MIPDRKVAASYLVDMEYYQPEFREDCNKDILWGCYGNILVQNVELNVKQNIELPLKRKAYQTSQEKTEEIVKRIEQIKKKQEELVAVPIAKNIYDSIFNMECKKNCQKDRELLYIYMFCIRDTLRKVRKKWIVFYWQQGKR